MYALASSAHKVGVASPAAVAGKNVKLLPLVHSTGLRPMGKQNTRLNSYKPPSKTTQVNTQEMQEKLNEYADNIKAKWRESDEKPALVAIGVAGIVGLAALNGVVNAVDHLPIVSGLLELVGIVVTGWFVYRYLLYGPDREELVRKSKDFVNKVAGQKVVD